MDVESRIIYNLECKDTVKAKNMHEMKKEMDSYLGREKGKGLISKHSDRDTWLQSNKGQLIKLFPKIVKDIEVKSVIITSEVIPLSYLKSEVIPLPIISFPILKREGISLLYQL